MELSTTVSISRDQAHEDMSALKGELFKDVGHENSTDDLALAK